MIGINAKVLTLTTAGMLISSPVFAAYALYDLDDVNLWDYSWLNPNNTTFDMEATATFCVESFNGGNARRFQLAVDDLETPGNLQLTSGSNSIDVSFQVDANGSGPINLPGNPAGQNSGFFPGSLDAGSGCGNAVMTASMTSASYPPAGNYTGGFSLTSTHFFEIFIFQFPIATRNINFALQINDLVRISGIENLNLNATTLGADVSDDDDFCIFRNGAGTVTVSASSSLTPGAGTPLTLKGPDTPIPYQLTVSQGANSQSLTSNGTFSGSFNTSDIKNCAGGTNSNVEVSVLGADWSDRLKGTYQDTITLTITPD